MSPQRRPACRPARPRWLALFRRATLAIAAVGASASVIAQTVPGGCGSLVNNYGPFDYRKWKDVPLYDPVTREASPLQLVEGAHFIDTCEALHACKRGTIGTDIDYTLRAFPNHHRALVAMMRYGERTKRAQPPDARYTVDCYFKRALFFQQDDAVARLIYVTFLNDSKRNAEARDQLKEAARHVGDSAFSNYNLGMVALDLNDIDTAVGAARKSYGAGMLHPLLRQRLEALNRWPADLVLPVPGAAAASAPDAAASGSSPDPAQSPLSAGAAAAPARADAASAP